MKDLKTKQNEVDEARERNIVRIKQGRTINVVPEPVYLGDEYTQQQTKFAEENTQRAVPYRTVGESVIDTLLSIDAGVNSAVNNAVSGVTTITRNSVNFGTALVQAPVRAIGSAIEGESPGKAFTAAILEDYLPSSAESIDYINEALNLVPSDEYKKQTESYYSDKFRFQENQLNELTSTDSELDNLVNTLRYLRDNPSYLAMGAARELGDTAASVAMGGALAKGMGISSKVAGSLAGEFVGGFGGAVNELNSRGVDIDSAKALATAGSIAAVNVATQKVFNTKYSPEEVIDKLLKVSADSSSKFIQPNKFVGKTLTGAVAEGAEEAVQGAYETGAINLASGENITSGMGRNVGEGVALGSTLGGTSSLLGGASKDSSIKNKQLDPNTLNPDHKNYDPVSALSNVLVNTQSPDASVRQQAQSEVSKVFNDAYTHFNSLVSEMNNETDETKKAELKDKVIKHYNSYIRPIHASHEAYSNVADTGLNPGEIFSKNQELNAKKLADIKVVSEEYSPYLSNNTGGYTRTDTKSQPVRVALMGDISKKDTGRSTNDHYDLRLAKVNGNRGDISQYLDRFMVNGKPLNSYTQTGNYMSQRKGYKHEGVDYGFDTSFGKDTNARNLYVNPKYQVTDIRAFDNNKHGGGWVTQVTFSDGIKVNILHQNKEGAQSVADEFKTGAGTTDTRTSASNVNTSWSGRKHRDIQFSNRYDGLLQEVYSKHGFSAEEQSILKAQIAQESNFNIDAESSANAFGLTQFIPGTADKYGVRRGDARSQIEGQARFMKDLLNRYNGDWAKALAAYNTGAGNVDKHWGSDGTGKGAGVMTTQWSSGTGETLKYVENILAHANVSGMSGATSSYQSSESFSELDQLNNLLNQWEQEEANATNEAERAKLQEQIDTLKSKLDAITNTEQEQQAVEQEARQAFAVEFNPNLSQEEIDNNPFLSDKEKEEYKQSLGVIQEIEGIQPNDTQPESLEAVRRNYDDIEKELQPKQEIQTEQRNQDNATGLIDNEPIFTKRFSLSTTTPEDIDSNPKLSDNQKRAIHKMMDVQRQVADTRDVEGVTNDIIIGSTGNTLRESNRGLQDYISGFENAINNNNIKLADELFNDLEYLRDTRISKNNAVNQALQLVQDNGITDINSAPIIAQDADTKEWFVTEYTGLREAYPEFDGSNAITVFKPNRLTEQLSKESKLVDDFTNAWLDYLSDYDAEGASAPVLDTSMATIPSKSNNRVTRSYDEAEANFDSKEFTQERVKTELPQLVETNKKPVDIRAGKIQLVQDVNQVPEEGTFLGRGIYRDESGKSRPSSMYDMEQGRINIGDTGWLASPYNAPRQGYKPNSFTLADTKPATHAEAYGSYFKRMFMQDDSFANVVLQLEPSKLYRTKYSTTEAQFVDALLKNVPEKTIDNAREWLADKVYGIENGKPSFKVSNKDDVKPKNKTKKETKTENNKNTVDVNTYIDTSEELTTLKLDKDTRVSIKEQLTGKSSKTKDSDTETKQDTGSTDTKSIDTKSIDTKEEFSTINTDDDSDTGNDATTKTEFNETDKDSLTGFKRESTTVNTIFKITPAQVGQEKQKHWQSQNHLILGFKQEGDNPLVSILDLASNLEQDYETGIKEVLPKVDVTEVQLNQLKGFLDFNKRFSKSLKESYYKETITNDGRDYSYRDFKGYLQKEDDSFDENILTALSLATYSHFIVNSKDKNTFKDVGRLLGYPEEVNAPPEVLHKYLYLGDKYNHVVNSIGRTAYDLLGLKTNKDVSELYKGRMIASLGNWVTSTLVSQGLMYEYTMPNSEFKKDSFGVGDAENSDETTNNDSTVTFISFTKPNGGGKVKYIDGIVEANKGTHGFLGKLFGGDVGLRSPTLEPTENVKRYIRGTTAKVSDTQANLQKHMQQEPIVVNKDSFNTLHKLVKQFPVQAKTMIGAYISEDTLNNMHESKREGAQDKAEGSNKELERLIGFTSGLNKDDEGNYQEFFDSNYVTKNNRGQYNSNEVNMQTMKIHRAMIEYKNFEQVIEANILNGVTGTETDFVIDDQLTDLGHLFSAIAENAKGTEDAIKDKLSHLTYRRGFTVDKVRAEDFLPAFFEHLETDEAIQNAVISTQKLLEGKELKQTDMDNIQAVVDAWGTGALSFRALIEYTKFKQAQKDNNDLITSFGLDADGVNNGSAISYTLMGLMVNDDNPDLMNQIGVFTEESGFSNFHETRLKGLKDYYEGLGTIMEQELSNYEPGYKVEVNLFYRLNPSIQGRKGAKEVLIPAGYGAGIKRLLGVAFESMVRDITSSYESLHLRDKELEGNKTSMTEAEYTKTLQGIKDDYNKLQDDLRVALGNKDFNLPHPKDMLTNKAFLTREQQETLKYAYDDVIGTLIINSFNQYADKFNIARRANIRFHESSANIYLTLHKAQLDKALEAKKEKIKEDLDTNHKELVQNRLVNSNARRAKNKEPLTYEDILEAMAEGQLEFEGLTKQEYKDKVEKPLLKVFPTLSTAFNYDEPKHKRKFSDIRILKSKTTTVDVADSYQMKTKGTDGKVKYKKASILTQEWVSATVAPNSAQVQGVDARIAFEAAAMNGNVSLNVHDNVISGRRNYVPMVRVLNKKFYETTRDYHANLASVNAFMDTLNGLVNIKDELNEEVFNNTLIDSLIDFLGYTRREKRQYLTDRDFKTIMTDVAPQVINEVSIAIQRDIQKLKHYEKVTIVHQYAGYGGEYKLTAEDKAKEREELEKLEKIQETVKERITKLLARVSKPNNSNLEKLAPSNFINHTGGAYGADTAWDLVGREFGVTNHKHYRAEGAEKLSKGLKDKGVKAEVLPRELIGEYRNKVNSALNGDYKDDYVGNLQARNYAQVINSDTVYAITRLDKNHKGVMGGTNTAVRLAIKLGTPVYVWDVDSSKWYTYKIGRFVESDTPRLTKNFAGIGTRDIESFKVLNKETNEWIPNPKYLGDTVRDNALNAIRDVYNNSILETKEVERKYTLSALKRFVDKFKEDSPEFNLFDYLESVFDKNKDIRVVFTDNLPDTSVEGMYDNKTNKIYFRASLFNDTTISKDKKIRLINHELIHALTETGLRLGKAKNSKAYQDLTKMYEQIKDKANGKFNKELSDINEFIAYGLTDEKFRKFIADNLDAKDVSTRGRFRDTLTKFLKAVHSILGFNTNNNFDKFTKTVHSLIVPYEAITETSKTKQRYSQSNITSDMGTVEVIKSLDDSMIGTEHNQRLNELTERIIGTFGMNSKQDTLVDNDKILQSDALIHGFKMSDKEIAVYNSLHAVFTTMENHKADQNYQSLVKLYDDAKKQLSYKDFITTNRPTSEDVSEAKGKYDYVFNSTEHLDDRIAVFASLGLANEEMVKVLQKPRKVKQREVESWFDKLVSIFDLVFKTLTEQAFFKGGKDFQSQLDVISSKLLRVDADVRANKQALHDIAWQGVGIITKPLNKAVHLAMNKASKQLNKLEESDNVHLSNLGAIFNSFEEMKEDGRQVEMANIISKINENSAKGRYNEVRDLINESIGIVGDTSKTVMEKLLRLTQNIGRLREKHRNAVMRNIKSYFPNKGKDLTPGETSAVTRALLRTDVSSLLNDDNQAEVYKLITDNNYRQEAIEELHYLISSFKLSKPKTNGIIMSAMDLASYLAKEEVPNNLYKNAEGIARFYGQEGNTKLTEAIDKLATLQALEYVDKTELDTVKNMMKSYPDAMWNVLNLHKAYTTISKEHEFKYNKYSYQKGYLPQDTNNLRSLIHAEDMDEVIKLQNEGWELLTQSPEGMKQDDADLTTPRYLMFHKNSNYRSYNSGALDMKDTHTKGSVIYTYKNHKAITRYIKDKDNLMAKRNTTINPKAYNPFADTGNMVMAYDPNGAIINVHYEMRGATRDKYLERNNNFIDLMGLYVSGIDVKPTLMQQQADVAKVLHQDYKLNYKYKPSEFIILDPRSKDEKTQETLRMMPYSFRVEAERLFGKNQPIMIKKSVFLMTFGYKQLSLGDLFDKHFDDLGTFSKTFIIASKSVLGEKAKGRIMIAEYFVSRLTSLVADIIVIRNPDILEGNIISNSLVLMLRGVNPANVVKDSIRIWKQGRDYVELENELNDLRVKYQTAKDKTQIEKEMRDIYTRIGKHPLSVYFKQGLMSSIVEDVKIEDKDTYGSSWEEMLDESIDKYVPEKVKDAVDFFMMNRGSPLHNMMSHATQFSDFSAKVILIEHLKKQGMTDKQAIAEAQDVFVNFDIPTGAMMDYANRMGLIMFTKFFIRFQKAMVRALGRTPASTVLQHILVEHFTDQEGVLDPFVFNRLSNNPIDLAPLSIFGASNDILTVNIVDTMIPDIF